MSCACGSQKPYSECCEPYVTAKAQAPTAEALMRSRYTAHTVGAIAYLKDTLTADGKRKFDAEATRLWAHESEWLGLTILSTTGGATTDTEGSVDFIAKYKPKQAPEPIEHREFATFQKNAEGHWLFVNGKTVDNQPIVRNEAKVGRNDVCPCGSGKKFKKCHG